LFDVENEKIISIITVSSCYCLAGPVLSVPINPADFFSSAITVNFDFRPDGSAIPGIPVPPYSGVISNPDSIIDDEYGSWGVLFSSTDGGAIAVDDSTMQVAGISSPNALIGTQNATNYTTGGPIFAEFIDPLTGLAGITNRVGAFSIDVDIAPVSFTVFDLLGNALETVFFEVGGDGSITFAGIYRAEGIASVAINSPGTDFLAIDNFIFEPVRPYSVPEPGMFALFGFGLAGIGFASKSKRS
jgi:hypothetical protein